ncbi:hypothetical protein DFH27DRAFT_618925 [Peziza echinospora]|nr:hypothetical protein DFH27DRAFT_618925 [Peziza echinospora]
MVAHATVQAEPWSTTIVQLLELLLEGSTVCSIAGGCRVVSITIGQFHATISSVTYSVLCKLSTLEPTSTQQALQVTLSEWNIGLLDGLNRLHQVPGLQLNMVELCTTWSQTAMVAHARVASSAWSPPMVRC